MTNESKTNTPFEVHVALAVRIFQILREQIITGKLQEGARLNEVALQKTFGTSRSLIREAFHHLETEGLVEITHRRGAFVRSISAKDVIEATAVRGCLEALALRLAPRPVSRGQLEELFQILQQMDEAKEKQDGEAFTSFYWLFHKAIIELSGNRILARIYRSVTEPFISDRLTYHFPKRPERFRGVGDHEIYDLLASGQILDAAQIVEQHAYSFIDYLGAAEGSKTPKERVMREHYGKDYI
jgi:DNA-binding GntR family transcriptional regulator